MELVTLAVRDIKPYDKNPRKNDKAVNAVAESIKQCGYCAPIVVDENNVVLAGHTRLKALKKLGITECQVCVKEGLTEEQKRKYRLLDNKTSEFAEWDLDLLEQELQNLDFEGFDFGFNLDKLEKEEKEEIEGEVPFAEVLDEENNYIVLKFGTKVDWIQLESLFSLPSVKAYSTRTDGKISEGLNRKGVGRVVDGVDFLNKIGVDL